MAWAVVSLSAAREPSAMACTLYRRAIETRAAAEQCGDTITLAVLRFNAALIAVFFQQLRDICARSTRCDSLIDA